MTVVVRLRLTNTNTVTNFGGIYAIINVPKYMKTKEVTTVDSLVDGANFLKNFFIWATAIVVVLIVTVLVYKFVRTIIYLIAYWRAKYLLYKQLHGPRTSFKDSAQNGRDRAYYESQQEPKDIHAEEVHNQSTPSRFPNRKL